MARKPPVVLAEPSPVVTVKPPGPPAKPKYLPPWETGKAEPVLAQDVDDDGKPLGTPQDFSHVHPQTAAIRRLFVAEFVKDFNMTHALARLGYNFKCPAEVATRWLKEPFTQYVLDQYIHKAEEAALVTRNEVIAALKREANSYGLDSSGASRVSALGKLAKILGMEIGRSESDVRVSVGVMVVPMAKNAEDWEAHAADSQRQLKIAAKA